MQKIFLSRYNELVSCYNDLVSRYNEIKKPFNVLLKADYARSGLTRYNDFLVSRYNELLLVVITT